MIEYDHGEATLMFSRAMVAILNDTALKKRWVEGDQLEKNTLLSFVVFRLTWDRAFSDGYDEGNLEYML